MRKSIDDLNIADIIRLRKSAIGKMLFQNIRYDCL